jgi:hypothetical protein
MEKELEVGGGSVEKEVGEVEEVKKRFQWPRV